MCKRQMVREADMNSEGDSDEAVRVAPLTIREQTFGMCIVAELYRIVHDRRMYLVLLIPVALASAVIAGTVKFMVKEGISPDLVTSAQYSVSVGAFLMAVTLGVGLLSTVSREMNDGTVVTTIQFIPNRLRMLAGRCLGTVIACSAVTFLWLLGVTLIVLGSLHPSPGLGPNLVAILLCATLATALAVLMMVLIATAVPNGAFALAILFVLNLVLPLGLAALNQVSSGSLTSVTTPISYALPGTLLLQAMDPPNASVATLVGSFAGLVMWSALLFVLAYVRIHKVGANAGG